MSWSILKSGPKVPATSLLLNVVSQYIFHHAINHEIYLSRSSGDAHGKRALRLYAMLKLRLAPLPTTCARIIIHLARSDFVEKAMLEYEEAVKLGMPKNAVTHSAMIYACSKRKGFYAKAFELLHQMDVNGMPVDLRVYNNILYACAKVSDLRTALIIWSTIQKRAENDDTFTPNVHTFSNILWSLASVETNQNKISLRPFIHSVTPMEIMGHAIRILHSMQSSGVPMDERIITAYLTVAANHRFREVAERVFNVEFDKYGYKRTALAYDVMFAMYDALEDYKASVALKKRLDAEGMTRGLSLDGWRSLVRTAALATRLDEAVAYLEEMNSHGHVPNSEAMQALHLRIFENERWDLRERMLKLVRHPAALHSTSMAGWRNRAEKLDAMMEHLYGHLPKQDRPRLAK